MTTTTSAPAEILERIRAHGADVVLVDAKARVLRSQLLPRELLEEARAQREGIIRLLADQAAPSALGDYVASTLAARVRFTLVETADVEGDLELLRALSRVIAEHPGDNLITATVRSLDGTKRRVRWRALASRELRRAIAAQLAIDGSRLQLARSAS